MGSDNFLHVDLNGVTWTSRVDSRYEPDPGEQFTFTFDLDALHLFADDGTTIKSKSERPETTTEREASA